VYSALDGSGSSDNFDRAFVSRDSTGKLWALGRYYNGTNYYIRVVRSTNADDPSAWDSSGIGQPTSLSDTGNTDSNVYGELVPLSSSDMYSVWMKAAAIEGKLFDDPTNGWDGSATSIATGTSGLTKNFSAVSTAGSPDRVHLSYLNGSSNVIYDQYNTSDNNWTTFSNVTLDSNTTNSYTTLSQDTNTNDLYALWVRSDTLYYKKGVSGYASGDWDAGVTSWQSNGVIAYPTSSYAENNHIFATWTQADINPYSIFWEYIVVPEKLVLMFIILPVSMLFFRKKRK